MCKKNNIQIRFKAWIEFFWMWRIWDSFINKAPGSEDFSCLLASFQQNHRRQESVTLVEWWNEQADFWVCLMEQRTAHKVQRHMHAAASIFKRSSGLSRENLKIATLLAGDVGCRSWFFRLMKQHSLFQSIIYREQNMYLGKKSRKLVKFCPNKLEICTSLLYSWTVAHTKWIAKEKAGFWWGQGWQER